MSKSCREVPHHIASYLKQIKKITATGENGQRKTDVAVGPGQEKS